MKHTNHLPFFLASLLLASTAIAQTADRPVPEIGPQSSEILEAHSRYTQTAEASTDDSTLSAQLPRGGPTRPFPPPHRNSPRRSYQQGWMSSGNGGHALIGAAIGFGLGALIGAKANTDQHARAQVDAVVIFGGLGALCGAVVGAGHGGHSAFAHHKRAHPPTQPNDDAVRNADLRGSQVPESRAE